MEKRLLVALNPGLRYPLCVEFCSVGGKPDGCVVIEEEPRKSRVDSDDLLASTLDEEHTIETLGERIDELHICKRC